MKAKITKGSGFGGVLRYVLDIKAGGGRGSKRAEVLEVASIGLGQCYELFMKRFALCAALRPNIKKPVWHCSLSLPEGEKLEPGRWEEVVESFLARMGFGANHPRAVVRHGDKEHDHVHIVCCRIGMDGRLWDDSHDVRRAIGATQELEKEFRLTPTKGFGGKPQIKNTTFSERKMEDRTGEAAPRVRLQEIIGQIVAVGPTAVEFCEYLEASGVEVRANLAGSGKLNGFSFSVDGIAFKGSSLGKAYAWEGLQKKGVSYDPGRDFDGLARFAAGTEKLGPGAGAAKIPDPDLKERLKGLIDGSVLSGPTIAAFCERLEAAGVVPKANLSATGRLNGFSFEIGGETFAGSSLGKAYGWAGLQKRGVSYDPGRDFDGLRRFSALAGEPAEPTEPTELKAESPKSRLQRLVSLAADGRPTAVAFCRTLEAMGVGVKVNLAATGRLNGFSFELGGETHTGSSLGKVFGWAGLRDRGVSYEPDRDMEGLRTFSSQAWAKEAGVPALTEAPPKARLKKIISLAAGGGPSKAEFFTRLGAKGVGVKANLDAAGRFNGFTFSIGGVDFNGASLGEDYSAAGLRKLRLTNETKGESNEPGMSSNGAIAAWKEPQSAGSAAEPTSGRAEREAGVADGGTATPEDGDGAFFSDAGDALSFGCGLEGSDGSDFSGDREAGEDERESFGFGRSSAGRDKNGNGASGGSGGGREDVHMGKGFKSGRSHGGHDGGQRRRLIYFATLDFIRRSVKPRPSKVKSESEKARLRRQREEWLEEERGRGEEWFGFARVGESTFNEEWLSMWAERFDFQMMDDGSAYFYEHDAKEPSLKVTSDKVFCLHGKNVEMGLWVAVSQWDEPIGVVGPDSFKKEVREAVQKMYEEYGIAVEIVEMAARPTPQPRPGPKPQPAPDDDDESYGPRMA